MFKPDREKGFAKAALDLMGECAVVSTPENFELFYAHVSGENPAITQIMGAAIAAKKPFTAELLQDLRLRCLSGARAALERRLVLSRRGAIRSEEHTSELQSLRRSSYAVFCLKKKR